MKNKKILFSILLLLACLFSANLAFAGEFREFEVSWPEIPGTEFVAGDKCPDEGCPPQGSLSDFVSYIFTFSLTIIGFVAFFNLIYAGIIYMTAGIDPSKKSQAMDKIKNSVLGIILLFGSYLVLNAINPELVALGETQPQGRGISSLNSIILYQDPNCNLKDDPENPIAAPRPCNIKKDCQPPSEGGDCVGCSNTWECDLNLNDFTTILDEDRKAGLCIDGEKKREEISDETATSNLDVGSVKINGEIIVRLCQKENLDDCAIIELMNKSIDKTKQCTIQDVSDVSDLTPPATAARAYISGVGADFSNGNLKSAKIEGNFHRTKTILFSKKNYGGESQSHNQGRQSTENGDVGNANASSIYIKKDPSTNWVAILCREERGDCEIENQPNPDLGAVSAAAVPGPFGPPPTFNGIDDQTKFIYTLDTLDDCSGALIEDSDVNGVTDFIPYGGGEQTLANSLVGENTVDNVIDIGINCGFRYWDNYNEDNRMCKNEMTGGFLVNRINCIEIY